HVARRDRRDEALAVVAAAEDDALVGRVRRERVHVVEGAAGPEAIDERRIGRPLDEVPADVRQLRGAGELADLAAQDAEAFGAAELGRCLEQELHAQADAEQRPPFPHPTTERLHQPALAQVDHRLGERADAGQDEAVDAVERRGVVAHHDLGADVLERLLHRAAVAHAVVDQANAHAHAVNVPFVDGTPGPVGAVATAAPSARAVALDAPSLMWWGLWRAATATG